jgi:hypothetical protein
LLKPTCSASGVGGALLSRKPPIVINPESAVLRANVGQEATAHSAPHDHQASSTMRAILREGFAIHRREGSDGSFALTVGWRRLFELSC